MPPEGSNRTTSRSAPRREGKDREGDDNLTLRDFSELASGELKKNSEYRTSLLCEAVETLFEGDHATAQLLMRDYVNATMGFEGLAQRTDISSKSLMRMLSVEGNPRASNLVRILHALQAHEGITFRVESVGAA